MKPLDFVFFIVLIAFVALALNSCALPVIWHYVFCGDEACHPTTEAAR